MRVGGVDLKVDFAFIIVVYVEGSKIVCAPYAGLGELRELLRVQVVASA